MLNDAHNKDCSDNIDSVHMGHVVVDDGDNSIEDDMLDGELKKDGFRRRTDPTIMPWLFLFFFF